MLHLERRQTERTAPGNRPPVLAGKEGQGDRRQVVVLAHSPSAHPSSALACGRGGNASLADVALAEMLICLVSAAFAVGTGEIKARTRGRPSAAFARQAAMYLSHVALALTFSEVGRLFGRDRTTAAHACRLVEDRRDDPRVDLVLGALEALCSQLRRSVHDQLRRRP